MRTFALLLVVAASALAAKPSNKLLSAFKKASSANAGSCTKSCAANNKCVKQTCQVCVPKTCADMYCPAGTICNDLPSGPDCVPDVPSCEGFYCRRGTNCYVRVGSPICLPNTCEIRVCEEGLTCIDTPAGALCKRGKKTKSCGGGGKYCPANSKCVETKEKGAHCIKI